MSIRSGQNAVKASWATLPFYGADKVKVVGHLSLEAARSYQKEFIVEEFMTKVNRIQLVVQELVLMPLVQQYGCGLKPAADEMIAGRDIVEAVVQQVRGPGDLGWMCACSTALDRRQPSPGARSQGKESGVRPQGAAANKGAP